MEQAAGVQRMVDLVGRTGRVDEDVRGRLDRRLAELLGPGSGPAARRHVVYVAAKLGVADALAAGPRSAEELARAVGAHAETLRRVMRALVAMGVFTQDEEGRFGLDERGHLLRSDGPEPLLRGRVIRSAELEYAWSGLLHGVMTGEPVFEHVFGKGPFPHFAADPAVAALGSLHNPGSAWELADAIAESYDFGRFRTVVDVGGGNGTVVAAILRRYPAVRGVVLDQPHLMDDAQEVMARAGVAARCACVGGDFFQEVPDGDAFVLKTILHDWDDARAAQILVRCREAMRPGGRVVVAERLLPERAMALAPGSSGASGFSGDVMMLVETGGKERTEREYRELFGSAGLALEEIRQVRDERYANWSLLVGLAA